MNGKPRKRPAARILLALAISACSQRIYVPPPPAPAPAISPPPAVLPSGAIAPSARPAAPATREMRVLRNDEDKSRRGDLDLKINRLWMENGYTYASLTVTNTSGFELEEVTIKCTAFGAGHVNLDFREQTLLTSQDGPMRVGFTKTMKIRLERGGFEVRSMSCHARGW